MKRDEEDRHACTSEAVYFFKCVRVEIVYVYVRGEEDFRVTMKIYCL